MSQLNLGNNLIIDSDYSTSETETGATWIDGKPIYRRVLSEDATPYDQSSRRTVEVQFDMTDKKLVNAYGRVTITGGDYNGNTFIIGGYQGSGSFSPLIGSYIIWDSTLRFRWCTTTAITVTSAHFEVVVEYTKTTD